MTRTGLIRRTCAVAVVAGAIFALGTAAATVERPARAESVLPTMTPLIVSATGGGSLTSLGHAVEERPGSLTQATGGGPQFPTRPISASEPRRVVAPASTLPSQPVAVGFVLCAAAFVAFLLGRRRSRRTLHQLDSA